MPFIGGNPTATSANYQTAESYRKSPFAKNPYRCIGCMEEWNKGREQLPNTVPVVIRVFPCFHAVCQDCWAHLNHEERKWKRCSVICAKEKVIMEEYPYHAI